VRLITDCERGATWGGLISALEGGVGALTLARTECGEATGVESLNITRRHHRVLRVSLTRTDKSQ
jgi:hypothetical protein